MTFALPVHRMTHFQDPEAIRQLQALGGPALVEKMIRLFLENTPRRIGAAVAGERAGDWSAVEHAAHSLKSSAAYLGLTGLRDGAARIERCAAQGPRNDVRSLLAGLAESFPAVRRELLGITPAAPGAPPARF